MKYLTARFVSVWSGLFLLSTLTLLTSCKKDPPPSSNGNAQGYLTSLENGCSPSKIHGIWYNGITAGTDSNYLEVTVNVTTPGKYNISSGAQNGVTFTGSGNFSEIGVYTVRLRSSGAFTKFGPTTFPLKFDSSSCNFIVYVQDSATRSYPDNTWECTANGRYYKGTLNTYQTGLNLPPGEATALSIYGIEHMTPTEAGSIGISINQGKIIDTGTYKTTDANYVSFSISAFDSAKAYPENYIISGGTWDAASTMTIHIKSIENYVTDDNYKVAIYGTFSGMVRDAWHQNHYEPVTNGIFKLVK
jgi:hypothetical protein